MRWPEGKQMHDSAMAVHSSVQRIERVSFEIHITTNPIAGPYAKQPFWITTHPEPFPNLGSVPSDDDLAPYHSFVRGRVYNLLFLTPGCGRTLPGATTMSPFQGCWWLIYLWFWLSGRCKFSEVNSIPLIYCFTTKSALTRLETAGPERGTILKINR